MLYPIVYAFVCRGPEILIQRRSTRKDISPGLLAESAGGHVTVGESLAQAVTRETREELGISCSDRDFELVGTRLSNVNGWTNYLAVYRLEYSETAFGPISIDRSEVDSVRWWRWDEVLLRSTNTPREFSQMFAHTFREFAQRLWPAEYNAAYGLQGEIRLSGGMTLAAAKVEEERIDGYPERNVDPLLRCSLRAYAGNPCATEIADLYITPHSQSISFALLALGDGATAVSQQGSHNPPIPGQLFGISPDSGERERDGSLSCKRPVVIVAEFSATSTQEPVYPVETPAPVVLERSYTAVLSSPPTQFQTEADLAQP